MSEGHLNIVKPGILLLVVFAAAEAQIYPPGGGYPGGGYPGGGYPGGGYPGGGYPYPGRTTGPGIPIPGRSSKGKAKADPNQPLPNFRGKLKQMDAKTISLELGDNRVLDFKRTDKTKFFKSGDEIKSPEFSAGDQLSIESQEAPGGAMTAVNVYWEKAASAATARTGEDKDGAVDTWKDDGKQPTSQKQGRPGSEQTPADQASSKQAADRVPPARRDPDDPGPPTLKRGKPADSAREHSSEPPPQPAGKDPVQVAANNPAPAPNRPSLACR